jgi:hypothetical protein
MPSRFSAVLPPDVPMRGSNYRDVVRELPDIIEALRATDVHDDVDRGESRMATRRSRVAPRNLGLWSRIIGRGSGQ